MIKSEAGSRKSEVRMKNKKAAILFYFIFFAFCCSPLAFYGKAFAKDGAEHGISTITDIEVLDYAVKIKADGPIKYSLNKSDDPFRIKLELENVSLGKFKNRIFSYKAGITDIMPSQTEKPNRAVHLDILLQSPAGIKPELLDNTLTLFVEHEEKALQDEVVSLASPSDTEDGPEGETAGEITDVLFESTGNGTELIIRGDGPMPDPSVFDLDGRLIIDIPGVTMGAPLPSQNMPPVHDIRYREDDDKTRFILDLEANAGRSVFTVDDEVVVDFASKSASSEKTDSTKRKEDSAAKQKEGGEQQPEANNRKSGLVSLDFQDADIIPILRLLSDVSGYNIVVHPDVKGKITMKLLNVPWEQAMDIILKTFGLEKVVEGNIIRVAPIAVFVREREEATKFKQSKAEETAGIIESRPFPINYADVSVVEGTIKNANILTKQGSISSDKRTSTIVINDLSSTFPKIEELLKTLDKPTPQVLIEARIVEINTSDTKDLGIQWGLNYKPSTDLFSVGGLSGLTKGPFTGNSFAVDFPGSSGVGSGSGFTFGILNPARTLGLDVQLSALESVSKGKIISTPRIVTLDSEKAKIMQGTSEPYPQLSGASGNVSAAFKDVALTVEVTPHITPDGSVGMEVSVVKEDILSTVQISGSQVPRTSKVESKTKVLIQSGETIVIGGVQRKNITDSSSGVPGLKDIPLLGWLFKNKSVSDKTSELLIFITPRIMEKTAGGK